MQNFGHRDFFLYFLLTLYFIGYDNGVGQLLLFILNNAEVLFTIGYRYLCQRYYLPFPFQTTVSQRSTGVEFVIIEALKYNLHSLTRKWSMQFFKPQVFNLIYKIRYLREAGNGLGDVNIYTTDKEEVLGTWIKSTNRSDTPHDIIVLYVNGSWIVGGSSDLYAEYLTIFCVNLREQGFRNPAIFAPSIAPDKIDGIVNEAYQYVKHHNQSAKIVLAGDSIGATLILNFLLENQPEVSVSVALLLSPITQLRFDTGPLIPTEVTTTPLTNDYLSIGVIESWVDTKVISPAIVSPGLENWDNKKIATSGVLISYGSEECVAEYTEAFIEKLKLANGCKLIVDKQMAQVHNWSILNFYAERLVEHREESLQYYSATLSRLLLSETSEYFGADSGKVKNIITIDEHRV